MGEELSETLLREGREEAGWDIQPLQLIDTHSDWFYHLKEKKYYRSLQLFFTANGNMTGKPTDKSIEQVELVPIYEIDQRKVYPDALVAFKKAVELNLLMSGQGGCGSDGCCGGTCGGACGENCTC